MKNLLFLLTFFTVSCAQPTYAQHYVNRTNAPKRALEAYEKGIVQSKKDNFEQANRFYLQAIKKAPNFIDAYLILGWTNLRLKEFTHAEAAFTKAIALDKNYQRAAYVGLAEAEWALDKYAACADHAAYFLQTDERNEQMRARAKKLEAKARFTIDAMAHPVPFSPKPMPGAINSEFAEYLPSFTADGQMAVFTRRDLYDENFYISELDEDGNWQEAVYVEGINTDFNEGASYISPDGTVLLFMSCENEFGKVHPKMVGSCDMFYALKKGDKWTSPRPFASPLNSKVWDGHPCLSSDGKELYFASKRAGGSGEMDLWVATRGVDNRWQKPVNLGDSLNTAFDEQTPFLHPDGKTLYFTSNGHPGLGSNDVFMSRRQADGTWGAAQNLGYPINTKGKDGTLAVSLDGKTAYYSARASADSPQLDLFQFEMPEAFRPQAVTFVRAKVVDKAGKTLANCRVNFTKMDNGKNYVALKTQKDGTALACLPAGTEYALTVDKEGYTFFTENFNFKETRLAEKPYELLIRLDRYDEITDLEPTNEVKYTLSLKNILFDVGSSDLKAGSYVELNLLLQLLEKSPEQRVIIEGHTDNVGSDTDNQRLSEERAHAVYDFLVEKGITPARLQYRGKGESEPLESNDTESGRAANRRTVILFL